jgi:YegS/Rv2252/BmrU family lipid kinase
MPGDKRFHDPKGRGMAPHKRDTPALVREPGAGTRNRDERICLVVNPHAGAGRARMQVDDIRRAADRAFEKWDVRVTEGPGHAETLAAAAVTEGFDLVAAVGGDGTCHEVVNGFFDGERPRSKTCAFAVVPMGTGSDLVRSLHTPRALDAALWVAATGVTLPTDVGFVELFDHEGKPVVRRFINVAGFGAQGDVVRRANEMDKRWGGKVTFLRASIASARSYPPPRVTLHWDGPNGASSFDGEILSTFVANGEYCGGGMWVARGGSMHDGMFDVTRLVPIPFARLVLQVHRLYDGHLDRMSCATRFLATSLTAEPTDPSERVPIDLDGEAAGRLPATFRILSRGISIRAGWRRPRIG